MKKSSLGAILVFSILFLATKADSAVTFDNQEALVYNEFILPIYPDGLRANWNGVYATYLDWHTNDNLLVGMNKNHEVSTESTSLLAHYAALIGDQAVFDQMYDLWSQESYFLSQKFQLEQWLLNSLGGKIDDSGNLANASGEEVRMLEVLKIADDKFTPTGGRSYEELAIKLAEGLKGVGGGQGNFEPPYAYATDSGDGGEDYIYFEPQNTRYVRINCLTRNTAYGYSLWEVEVYGPDTGSTNLALEATATATASSIQGAGFEADKAIDDDSATTRWSSQFSDPQYIEIDLGSEKRINQVVLKWEIASAKSYNIDLQPYYVPKEADGYLLRPWFIWSDGTPVSKPWDPIRVPLNYNNYVSYYYAAKWLGDSFYQKVLDYTLGVVENSQNTNPLSPGRGLFKTIYELSTHQYLSEYGDNACTTISGCDIASRIGAYGHLVSDQQAIDTGRLYFDFLKAKYINDGVIFGSYDYDTGEPVAKYTGFVLYSFFAKLAIEYGDYDLAEKIIREQILPYQVDDASDPGFDEGYYGAFKSPSTKPQASEDIWKDASAFANLETLMALHKWNTTDKGSWVSSYPLNWITVASVTSGDGGEDVAEFNPVNTRYLKILCKKHALPMYGYSIFTLQIFGPDTTDDLALNKKVSASSIESYECIPPKIVDDSDSTRWSSEHVIDPQWIYVDLGENKNINKVRILWEAAYATNYEIQIVPAPFAKASSVGAPGREADKAIDDDYSTRWASARSNNEWIYIDYGQPKAFNTVVLFWDKAYGRVYKIQTSNDGVTWRTIYAELNGNGGTDTINVGNQNARFIKMRGVRGGTAYGYSLWEFKLLTRTTARASSIRSRFLSAGKAVDNNSATHWSSAFSDKEWIHLDFGASRSFDTVRLFWGAAYASAYQIQLSNDAANWTTVYSTSAGDGGEDSIYVGNQTARYVKMQGITSAKRWTWRKYHFLRDLSFGYSLREFEVLKAVSSSFEGAGLEAYRATDSDLASRWSSRHTDNEWIYTDCTNPILFDTVKLNWEVAHARSYEIQRSDDGISWVTEYAEGNSDGGEDSIYIGDRVARYVKMKGIQRATGWGYSLWEFEAENNKPDGRACQEEN